MTERLDRILDAIDVGLQHAGDIAYGSDNGLCVRCQRWPAVEGSSWCADLCSGEANSEAMGRFFAQLQQFRQQVEEVFVPAFTGLMGSISQLADTLAAHDLVELPGDPKARALARKRRPFVCYRHGEQPGGFCRRCAARRR